MASMATEAREAFLARTRLGYLAMLTADAAPLVIPIWFGWDGERARMFTGSTSPKIQRLQNNPRVSLLVAAALGEKEEWVAIDGTVSIRSEGAIELAERLALKYWDLSDPDRVATLELWRQQASDLRLLELVPSRIRSYTN